MCVCVLHNTSINNITLYTLNASRRGDNNSCGRSCGERAKRRSTLPDPPLGIEDFSDSTPCWMQLDRSGELRSSSYRLRVESADRVERVHFAHLRAGVRNRNINNDNNRLAIRNIQLILQEIEALPYVASRYMYIYIQ